MAHENNRLLDRMEGGGSGDYFVNVGLFKNAEVADKSFNVVKLASHIYSLLPEINTRQPSKSQHAYKQINRFVPMLRQQLMELVALTRAQIKRTGNEDEGTKKAKRTTLITLSLKYCTIPLEKLNIKKFCSIAMEYHDMLVYLGIVPITAGYTDEDGMDKLLSS